MTASCILLLTGLCIPIALFAYRFSSIKRVNRWLRRARAPFFDLRLTLISTLFYFLLFVGIEAFFVQVEGYSFFALSPTFQGCFLGVITVLVILMARLATGGFSLAALPHGSVEKLLTVQGTFESDAALFLEAIKDLKGELVLDSVDKKLLIARLPLNACSTAFAPHEVIVELGFSESIMDVALVQVVCYSASRGVFLERKALRSVLDYLELLYTEKFLESLV